MQCIWGSVLVRAGVDCRQIWPVLECVNSHEYSLCAQYVLYNIHGQCQARTCRTDIGRFALNNPTTELGDIYSR